MCDKLWPGWDENIEKKELRKHYKIDNISEFPSYSMFRKQQSFSDRIFNYIL